jgi:2-methylcitrate dehydratase PrpD
VAIVHGLGSEWELLRLHFKPYPANHFTHAGIDAALQLRAMGLRPADIETVELGVATPVLRTIAEPPAEKARPSSAYTARFSGPFTFALALRGGGGLGVTVDDFTEQTIKDPELLALAARVRCVADPECDAIFPEELPAIARVQTRAGERHTIKVLENRGGPSRPLTDAELSLKFRLNAARALDDGAVEELELAIDQIAELDNLAPLTKLSWAGRIPQGVR